MSAKRSLNAFVKPYDKRGI